MKTKTALIIPDVHFPYADERAYDLMLKVAMDQKIDEIVLLGDFADFYAVNSHGKDAAIDGTLKEEVDEVNARLDELDFLFPKANKVFLEGNHEFRLQRFINKQAPDLHGLISVPALFELDTRDKWRWVPYTPDQGYKVLGGKLIARHEPVGGGIHCAHGSVVKAGCSVIFGHHHKIQESQVVMMNGQNHRGITCGWLGNKNSPVMQYVKNHHQWALGFNLVTTLEDGTFFAQNIHIIDYKCQYGGKVYKG